MITTRKLYRHRSAAKGVGLIEVLIAVLVMGIGLLGIAALQATALRNSQSSMERSQAVFLSYTIYDAMRANRNAALAGEYELGLTGAKPAGGTLASNDLRRWITALQANLGSTAKGGLTCDKTTSRCRVTVQWDDSRGTAGAAQQEIKTETAL